MSKRLGPAVLVLTLAVPLTAVPATTVAAMPRQVLVVDDDDAQCPHADFSTVGAAVAAAEPGALVRVCPGIYPGPVRVDKPLTLLGRPDVTSLDCFADSLTVDPATYPILQRPAGEPGNLLDVTAPEVVVTGLVLEGATTIVPEGPSIADAAVVLRSGSAPARVSHNLIRNNDLGVDLGGDGSARTRVDHNCIRDNVWGMASQRQDFIGGRVDHNETFRTVLLPYEIGWPLHATSDARFDSNLARGGTTSMRLENASDVVISDNTLEGGTATGVQLVAGTAPANQDITVSGNQINGFVGATGFGIGVGTNAAGAPSVIGLRIEANLLTGNNVGLSIQPNNVAVVARDNVADFNRQFGIWSRARAAGGLFQGNTMLGNGSGPSAADARDDNRTDNTWTANLCVNDIPVGTICGQ